MSVEIINDSRTSFGPRTVDVTTASSVHTAGVESQLVLRVDYADLATHVAGDVTGARIPAGSIITEVVVLPANTTFVGGTSYAVNMVELDGSAIDSIIDAETLAEMNAGDVVAFAALDGAVVGAADAYIEVVATGTFTAGEGTVVIKYHTPIV